MINAIWKGISRIATRILFRGHSGGRSTRLMGMYLHQTNSRDHFNSAYKSSRERRNGRFSTQRERD